MSSTAFKAVLLVFTSFAATSVGVRPDEISFDDEKKAAAEIFDERIMPIFRSPDPSSCVQCHLSSVDLKNYILPSHEKTFVSLRDQGLIDLDAPEKSKILELIQMGDEDRDKGARMIHEKMRQAEQQAFSAWIIACCNDESLRELPRLDSAELAKPDKPSEVIRHARKSRVVDSFVRNVWSQRMRCFPCHTPHEIQPNQKGALKNLEEWEGQYGDQMLIFKKTPEQTIKYLVKQSRQANDDLLPLINLSDPAKSLLVLKPTSKIPPKKDGEFLPPTYSEPVYHMGGLKMHRDDQSYKSFIAWIQDYANVVDGKYTSVEDLPTDNWFATKRVLRVKDLPESVAVGTPVQLFVYARKPSDRVQAEWSDEPIAFTQGTITPRRMVNGSLFLLAPPNDPHFAKLKKEKRNPFRPGHYLVRVYVDKQNKLAADPTLMLGDTDLWGQIEIKGAKWQLGFPKAETVSGKNLDD